MLLDTFLAAGVREAQTGFLNINCVNEVPKCPVANIANYLEWLGDF